jgi:apolipoprotein N-acyltransferase
VLSAGLHALSLRASVGPALALVALVPFLVAVADAPARMVVVAGVAYGVTLLTLDVVPWLAPALRTYFELSPVTAWVIAVGGVAALGAAHGAVLGIALALRPRAAGVLDVAWVGAVWACWDALRLIVPPYFPGPVLGLSQVRALPVLQLASVAGIAAVTALVATVDAALATAWTAGIPVRTRRRTIGTALVVLATVVAWGSFRLVGAPGPAPGAPTVVAVDPGATRMTDSTLERYVAGSTLPAGPRPALLVWPESALPADLEVDRAAWERLDRFVGEIGMPLVTGGVGRALGADGRVVHFNSVHLLRPGYGMASYHKRRLVPLAESWPAALGTPPRGSEAVAAGNALVVFEAGPLRVAPLVCFEIIDAPAARELAARNADLVVNVSNDAWFAGREAPHVVWASVRAVESGRPVLRAANAGRSLVVDPFGRLVGRPHEPGETGVLTAVVPATVGTLYARTGEVFLPACVLLVIGGMVPALRRLRAGEDTDSRSCPG